MAEDKVRIEPLTEYDVFVQQVANAIEDTLFTRFGPLEPDDLETLMLDVSQELTNRWVKR